MSGDVDKCPHEKYGRNRNDYTGRATGADTTNATGTATCRGGRHTHSSGSAKGRSCREIVGNERFSKEGGAGKAARIEGSGVGATRCGPHYDEANHLGASCWKVAHHQGGTFGEQVFSHQRRCGFAPKVNSVSRRPRGILNAGVDPLVWKLVQVENKEKGR